MKNNRICIFVGVVFILCISLLGYNYLKLRNGLDSNKSIHCVIEDKTTDSKSEVSFDFRNNQVYRYSIITTNKVVDKDSLEKVKNITEKTNQTFKGTTSKVWSDDTNYMIYEYFELDLLDDSEIQEYFGTSKKELMNKTRKELISSIDVYTGNDKVNMKCE